MTNNDDASANVTGRYEKPSDNFLDEIIGEVIEIGTGVIVVSGHRLEARNILVDAIKSTLADKLAINSVKEVVFEGYTAPEQQGRISFSAYDGDLSFIADPELPPSQNWLDWNSWMGANKYLIELDSSQALIFTSVPESFMVNAILAAQQRIVVITMDAGSDQEVIKIIVENLLSYGYKGQELIAALLRVIFQADIKPL